jgi:apurinic endonuclease APN1
MSIYFGAHTNISKGVLNGLKYITNIGGNVSQIFLGNRLSSQLKYKTKLNQEEKTEIKQYLKENNHKLFVHACYVLNLASKPPTSQAIQYQLESLKYDLELGHEIGSSGLVIHLGNQMKLTKEESYDNMVKCVMKVIETSKGNGRILLETSAGAGTQIGVSLDDLTTLWNLFPTKYHPRIGICIDTAHIFSAGIPINKPYEINKYFKLFDEKIGIKHLYLVHLNDSKAKFNARVDRHENLEEGFIFNPDKEGSIKALQNILLFLVKHKIPALLETPGDGSLTESQSGSYQYQLELIKKLVKDYKKLPKPSINLIPKYLSKSHSKSYSNFKTKKLKLNLNNYLLKKTKLKQSKQFNKLKQSKFKMSDIHEQTGGKSSFADEEPNQTIIKLLKELSNLLKIEKDIFRSRALNTASIILREYNQKIEKSEQLKGIPRVGKGTIEKVEEILKTGTIKELEDLKNKQKDLSIIKKDPKVQLLEDLESILGIGPVLAKKLIKNGVVSLNDLKEKVEKKEIELTHQQTVGLMYHKDLDQLIPREDAHNIFLDIEKTIKDKSNKTNKEHLEWKDLEIIHAGSYPSGKVASKDIDILLFDSKIKTKNDMKKSTLLIDLVEFLKKENKILEVLSLGSTKFLGVIPANPESSSNFVKHLDIRLIPTESRIPAYFFYTSGGKFNQMIRQIAKDKGFTLSEFDLKDSEGKIVKVKSEEEIFEKLGVNFIPMEDRRAL